MKGFLLEIHETSLLHCFESTTASDDDPPPLSVLFDGWKSAHDEPVITSELVNEELKQEWAFEFRGSLEDAQAQYPVGVHWVNLVLPLQQHVLLDLLLILLFAA